MITTIQERHISILKSNIVRFNIFIAQKNIYFTFSYSFEYTGFATAFDADLPPIDNAGPRCSLGS